MERVPESIKKAMKREPEMLASERAAMQQEELVRTILSKQFCQNVGNKIVCKYMTTQALRKLQVSARPASAPVEGLIFLNLSDKMFSTS